MTRKRERLVVPRVDDCFDPLVRLEWQYRLAKHTLGGPFLPWDLVRLDAVHLPPIREEQQIRVRSRVHEMTDHVVFAQSRTLDASPSPSLCSIGTGEYGFDVAIRRYRDDDLLIGDQILE